MTEPPPGTVETADEAAERVAATKKLRVLKENEWACVDPKCLHINLDYKNTCETCGKPKPRSKNKVGHEIGKDAAEKSKGLFAAEDWSCSKCGNINWARRQTCNICNAPKFGELEARTGYGGGYMDRQEVEYIERRDSDDEFDEFGRKKKKKGKGDEEAGGSGERMEEEVEGEGGEETEGEVEGEEDRRKYDLAPQEKREHAEEEESESSMDEEELAKYDLTFDESPEELRKKIMNNANKKTTENENENENGGGSDGDNRNSPKSDNYERKRSDRSPSSGSSCCSLCSVTNSPVRGRDDRDKYRRDRDRRPLPRSRSPRRKRRYID